FPAVRNRTGDSAKESPRQPPGARDLCKDQIKLMTMFAAFAAAFSHRRMVVGFAAARSALFAAVVDLINSRPCSAFCFFLGYPAFFISFLDIFRHPFLFVRITALIAPWHNCYLPLIYMFASLKAFAR